MSNDSAKPATDSNNAGKLDAFPLESLDAFDWNHWMTSIGISGCFRLESVDDLPRNTQPGSTHTLHERADVGNNICQKKIAKC